MKLRELAVTHINEMARPAKICPDCGMSMAGHHYWYKGGWKCKKENLAKAAAASDAPVPQSTPQQPTPVSTSASAGLPATSQPISDVSSTPADPKKQPTKQREVKQVSTEKPATNELSFKENVAKWAAVVDQASTRPRMVRDSFTVNPDNTVDVSGAQGVFCQGAAWRQIPFKFGKVEGNFLWAFTHLTDCSRMPDSVGGVFSINDNKIESFVGCPNTVNHSVDISGNPASSLEGIPRVIKGSLQAQSMPNITSLQGIDELIDEVHDIDFTNTPIQSHVLGLLLINGLTQVTTGNSDLDDILNKHLAGDRDEFACQEELVEAGFSKFARM